MNKYYSDQLKVVQEQLQDVTIDLENEKRERSKEKAKSEVKYAFRKFMLYDLCFIKYSMQQWLSDFIREKSLLQQKNDSFNKIWVEELRIREAIEIQLLQREKKMKEEIATLKNVIKIPRAHFKYLEKMK